MDSAIFGGIQIERLRMESCFVFNNLFGKTQDNFFGFNDIFFFPACINYSRSKEKFKWPVTQ